MGNSSHENVVKEILEFVMIEFLSFMSISIVLDYIVHYKQIVPSVHCFTVVSSLIISVALFTPPGTMRWTDDTL